MVQRGFRIAGRVQGVFFRAWTQELGEELGLAGTVCYRRDGTVEAHVVGPEDAVDRFAEQLWDGPPAAVVDRVDVVDSADVLRTEGFRILPTV